MGSRGMSFEDWVRGSLPIAVWPLWASVSPALNLWYTLFSFSDPEDLLSPSEGMSSLKAERLSSISLLWSSTHGHLCKQHGPAPSTWMYLFAPVSHRSHSTPPWAGLADSTSTWVSKVSSFPHPCCQPRHVLSLPDTTAASWEVSRLPPIPNPFSSLKAFSDFLSALLGLKPFNSFFIHLEPGLANYSPWTKSSPPPVFVNKLLLEHSHGHLSEIFIHLLLHYKGRAEQLWLRPCGPQSLKCLLSDPLQTEKVL